MQVILRDTCICIHQNVNNIEVLNQLKFLDCIQGVFSTHILSFYSQLRLTNLDLILSIQTFVNNQIKWMKSVFIGSGCK